jgi:hypothetical protein
MSESKSKSKTRSDNEIHAECRNRFIELANTIKDEGVDIKLVSHALMSASGFYTTYVLGGNEGGLTESGVDKVAATYKSELARIQKIKREMFNS